MLLCVCTGEVFDYLVAHGRMKEKEARVKFRQVMNGPLSSDDIGHWPRNVLLIFSPFSSFLTPTRLCQQCSTVTRNMSSIGT